MLYKEILTRAHVKEFGSVDGTYNWMGSLVWALGLVSQWLGAALLHRRYLCKVSLLLALACLSPCSLLLSARWGKKQPVMHLPGFVAICLKSWP